MPDLEIGDAPRPVASASHRRRVNDAWIVYPADRGHGGKAGVTATSESTTGDQQ